MFKVRWSLAAILLSTGLWAQLPQPDGGTIERGVLPARWLSQQPKCMEIPEWQVHEYNPNLFILRQSPCTDFEKPFIYLFFGKEKALLMDTGSRNGNLIPTLQLTVKNWLVRNGRSSIPLIVVHSHPHDDHMAGDKDVQALHDSAMVASAVREARGWYGRLLMEGFLKECDVSEPGRAAEFEQIAYGVRPMAVGLIRLYEATADRDYLLMAGLAASWLTGNNPAGRPMYDPATGRCYDGIRDSLTLNLNSGAESTIEALYTLIEVERYPAASACLFAKKVASGRTDRFSWSIFRGAPDTEVTLVRESATGILSLYEGEGSRAFCRKENIP